jgi:hypothetical protein
MQGFILEKGKETNSTTAPFMEGKSRKRKVIKIARCQAAFPFQRMKVVFICLSNSWNKNK